MLMSYFPWRQDHLWTAAGVESYTVGLSITTTPRVPQIFKPNTARSDLSPARSSPHLSPAIHPIHTSPSQSFTPSTPAPSPHPPLPHYAANPIPFPIFFTSAFFKNHSLPNALVILANVPGAILPLSTARPSIKIASASALSSATSSYSWFPTTVGATNN